jgi:hypothetical protein
MSDVAYGFVLSDPTTRRQFYESKVAFNVKEVRDYKNVMAYISEGCNRLVHMVVVKPKSLIFQPRIYYLDFEGNLETNGGLSTLLNECGDDLAEHIEATLKKSYTGKTHIVHWNKKGKSLRLNERHIIAEYGTKNEKTGNNLCLLDWNGDNKTGKLEVWYGQKVKRKEARVFRFPASNEKTF